VRNTGANFVLLRVGDQADVIHQELVEKYILVKNLNRLPLLNGHFRVTISTRNENEMFLQALREVLP
jgi:histidinol-phosphate aminotransferase